MTTRQPYIPPDPMTVQDFRDFKSIQDWTWQEVSNNLGISIRTVFDYNAGKNPIPTHVVKHCALIRLYDRTNIKLKNLEIELHGGLF